MCIAAGRDPSHHFSLVPDRLIAQHVCITCVDNHRHTSQFSAAAFFFHGGFAADEIIFGKINKALHASFEGAVNRAKLTIPSGEVFFEAHREECAHTKVDNAMGLARLYDGFVKSFLIFGLHPDFIAQVAGISDTV